MSRAASELRPPAPAAEALDLVTPCAGDHAALLLERARELARPEAQPDTQSVRESYIRFRLGSSVRYGIPYRYAEEILYVGSISRVPRTPAFVRGVINRRGDMLTVLDLKALFAVEGPESGEDARVIVASGAGITVGLLVDEVIDNDEFHLDRLDRPLPSKRIPRSEHVLGLHAGTIALLDLDALLGDSTLFDFNA